MQKSHITLEASNIHSGGGLVLLHILLEELSKLEIDVKIYLGYDHIIEDLHKKSYPRLKIIKTGSVKTLKRYFTKREDVVFLCNLPPFVKNKNSSLVFYNELFFKKKNLLKVSGIKFAIFNLWFKMFWKNVDRVLVQSPHIEDLIRSKTQSTNVINIPIYKKVDQSKNFKKEYDFCYVSSGAPHKNHKRLIQAMESLSKSGYSTSLVLTVPKTQEDLLSTINEFNHTNQSKITNLGYVDNSQIEDVYLKSKALVFPSLAEAFGMPLIEAHDLGLKVLVSDLPYAYDVFESVETFDPEDSQSIATKMKAFLDGNLYGNPQVSKLINRIDEYIKILTED